MTRAMMAMIMMKMLVVMTMMLVMTMMMTVLVMTMMIDLSHGHDGFVLLQAPRAGHLATRCGACYYFVSTYFMQSDAIHRPAYVLVQLCALLSATFW